VVLAHWTAHPARRRPRDVALVAAVVLITCGVVLASLGSLLLSVLAAVILMVAVAPFLLPTHYTLTDVGIEERRAFRRKSRQWSDLRRLQVGPRAALVSPFASKSWMDRYRGLIVMFDGADRDQVVDILERQVNVTDV
jgi:hypothetical protein